MKRYFILTILFLFFLAITGCHNTSQSSFTSIPNSISGDLIVENFLKQDDFKTTEITIVNYDDGAQNKAVRLGEYRFSEDTYVYSKNYLRGDWENNIVREITYQDNQVIFLERNRQQSYLDLNIESFVSFYDLDAILQTLKKHKAIDNEITFSLKLENLFCLYEQTLYDLRYEQLFKNAIGNELVEISFTLSDNSIQYMSLDFTNVLAEKLEAQTVVKTIEFKPFKVAQLTYPDFKRYETKKILDFATGDNLEMYVIEMKDQYGDAILFKSGNFEMLVDAGTYVDGPSVNKLIREKVTDGVLEVVVASHHHADHTGGFNYALDGIESVGMFLDYGYVYQAQSYMQVRNKYVNQVVPNAQYFSAYDSVYALNDAAKVYQFSDDLNLEVLDTGQYLPTNTKQPSSNPNDNSVTFILNYKEVSYFLGGDLSGDGDANLISSGEIYEEVTVFKVSHHGSRSNNSNSIGMLNILNPKIAVISAGNYAYEDPIFQAHPSETIVARLLNTKYLKESKEVYLNITMGTIVASTTGFTKPEVHGLGPEVGYSIEGVYVTGEKDLRYVDTLLYKARNGLL